MSIKISTAIVAVFLCLWAITSNARPIALSSQQIQYLLMAREAGGSIGWPETMESIVWQESSIGRFKIGDDGKSLGVAHVQVDTAISIMKKYQWVPQMSSKTRHERMKIAHRLIHDDRYNLLIASLYFNDCYQQFQDWRRALICYNGGAALAAQYRSRDLNSFSYVVAIKLRLRELREEKSRYYVLNSLIDPELASEQIVKVKTAAYFKSLPIVPSGLDLLHTEYQPPRCFDYVNDETFNIENQKFPSKRNYSTPQITSDNQNRCIYHDKPFLLSFSDK